MISEIRASDDDRQHVVELLQRHTELGRLSLDEFSDRIGDVYSARTLGELQAVTHDLPPVAAPVKTTGRRDLLLVFGIAAVTLLLLGVYMAVTR